MPEPLKFDFISAIDRLFKPRSIALVGATERSIWSNGAYDNLKRFGFAGPVHLVSPKGGSIYGKAAATSCAAVGEQVDAALLMVPEAGLLGAIEDLATAGIGGAVILTSGFAEIGREGQARQRAIADLARSKGLRLLGPNCLGFVNYTASAPLWATQLRRPMAEQTIAVVSQSGATAAQLAQFAYQQRVGFTHMISTGNEADIDVATAIAFLAREDSVKAIAVFLESVRHPEAFIAAVEQAHAAGKPVVVLKVGTSEAAALAAQAHTGSLVGDDRVFSAVCRQLGVSRVNTMEDLVSVTDLLARIGRVETPGLALVGMSGGVCEIATDLAEKEGVAIPRLGENTLRKLREKLPDFATPSNPLDVTGAAMLQPALLEDALEVIGDDPVVGLSVCIFDPPADRATAGVGQVFLKHLGEGHRKGGKPALMVSHTVTTVSGDARAMADEAGIVYSGAGLTHGIAAIGHLFRWSQRSATVRRGASVVSGTKPAARLGTEREVLNYLTTFGVPVVPGTMTHSAEEAAQEASRLEGPMVLKIVSADIAHKTEAGGVALGLTDAESVAREWSAMMERVSAYVPDAAIEGIVLSPMRPKGTELFVGTMRDPHWGPVIAVGLGGVFVEALQDTSLRLLPVSTDTVLEMFEELRGKAMLDGFRGSLPVDRLAAAKVIAAIGDAALALGEGLVSLEVNPLLVRGDLAEVLDGLVVWEDHEKSGEGA